MSEIRCRITGLLINNDLCKSCENLRYCTIQDKIYATKSKNNALKDDKVLHLGVWLTKTPTLNISKETYVAIDKNNSFVSREKRCRQSLYDLFPNKYEDNTCTTYRDD